MKIGMTPEQFKRSHKIMWDELAKTGGRDKKETHLYHSLRKLYVQHRKILNGALYDAYSYACFACGDAYSNIRNIRDCSQCPIKWRKEKTYCACVDNGSLFKKWNDETDKKKRKELAKRIANIPWKHTRIK